MNEYIEREALICKLNDIAADYIKDNSIQCTIAAGTVIDIRDNVVMKQPTSNDSAKSTNFDRIKAMSVDELAEFLQRGGDHICFDTCEKATGNKFQCKYESLTEKNCVQCMVEWLEAEVTE